jgi:hypothetical protein
MKKVISWVLCFAATALLAGELSRDKIKGIYHLGTPERGKNQVQIDFGQMGNKVVLAVACKNCPPATYDFLKEESTTLGVATFFNAMGLYVFQYDADSWIVVQPDGVLGRQVWTKIGHANIYSKDKNKTTSVSREQIESFAMSLSSKIMNQEVGKMSHSGGTYYLAMPVSHMSKPRSEYQVNFVTQGKKRIDIKPCDRCGTKQYEFLPEESNMAGIDIYRTSTSYYVFDLKDGVLITTFSNASGLGKVEWGSTHSYNVLSNNKAYIRQILASKEKQNTIDVIMTEYFSAVKTAFIKRAEEKRVAANSIRNLPKQGMHDETLRQSALDAANRWASSWSWKETLKSAYFTSSDWAIVRNKLTGVITGKVARGFITMTHPDGRCRFQYVSYRQDFDGSKYMNMQMTGVGPIYDLNCDKI